MPTRTGFDDALDKGLSPRTIGGQILDGEGHPAKDVVVFVKAGLPAGAQYPASKPLTIDQHDKTFAPHVSAVLVNTPVAFPNSDVVVHNVYSRSPDNAFDLGAYSKPESKTTTLTKPGRVDVFCAIHTNMHAIIHVLENPYFAVTDERGAFAIPDVPAGNLTLGVRDDLGTKERELPATVTADKPTIVHLALSEDAK